MIFGWVPNRDPVRLRNSFPPSLLLLYDLRSPIASRLISRHARRTSDTSRTYDGPYRRKVGQRTGSNGQSPGAHWAGGSSTSPLTPLGTSGADHTTRASWLFDCLSPTHCECLAVIGGDLMSARLQSTGGVWGENTKQTKLRSLGKASDECTKKLPTWEKA